LDIVPTKNSVRIHFRAVTCALRSATTQPLWSEKIVYGARSNGYRSTSGNGSRGYPGLTLPRVPGHEVVGRIEALVSGVSRWKIGQRVGVGLIAGEDGTCEPCRRGDVVNCQNPVVSGVTVDGGYAVPTKNSVHIHFRAVTYALRSVTTEPLWSEKIVYGARSNGYSPLELQ
jgi:hypothetical protein